MHIILGLLGALVTIFYLLDRLGIDIGYLNPFYWRRRRAWRAKYEGDPIHAVEDPREIAALFVIGVAKLDGEISAGQKQVAQREFASTFSMSERESAQLVGASAHLLGHPQVIRSQLAGVLERKRDTFNAEQAESLLAMVTAVASADGEANEEQREVIDELRAALAKPQQDAGVWTAQD